MQTDPIVVDLQSTHSETDLAPEEPIEADVSIASDPRWVDSMTVEKPEFTQSAHTLETAPESITPLSLFLSIIDTELIQHVTDETNRKRRQSQATEHVPFTTIEIKKYLGLTLLTGITHTHTHTL